MDGSPWLKTFLLLLGGFSVGVGLLFLIAQLVLVRTIFGSSKWPSVPGRIITSSVYGPIYGKYGPEYGADIEYRYSVEGGTCIATVIDPIKVYHETLAESQSLVQRYPLGKTVTVYYDPRDPCNAVLVPVASPANVLFGCLGLIFLGGGCLTLWRHLLTSSRREGALPRERDEFRTG